MSNYAHIFRDKIPGAKPRIIAIAVAITCVYWKELSSGSTAPGISSQSNPTPAVSNPNTSA